MASSNATVPAMFQASKRLRAGAGGSAARIQPGEPRPESQDEAMESQRTAMEDSCGLLAEKVGDLYPLPGFEPPPPPPPKSTQGSQQDLKEKSENVKESTAEQAREDASPPPPPKSTQGSQQDLEEESEKVTESTAGQAREAASPSEVEEEKPSPLSMEQKMRMELNKTVAQWKRNLRACESHIADSKKAGKFPDFSDLLVENSWGDVLQGEFPKPYMRKLHSFVQQEVAGKLPVYPPLHLVFNAFNACPFDKVKVVIIGQDPYHGPGQAMGLNFSVPQGTKIPSSLVNIFKEIRDDLGCTVPSHGNLEKWAHQGVLMLNAVLTVRAHHANSHAKKGWEPFTDAAIRTLSQKKKGVVFLLWGNSAQEKTRLINTTEHHILKAAHPSGLSAHKGFFNCRHFSKTNDVLVKAGLLPIDWQL